MPEGATPKDGPSAASPCSQASPAPSRSRRCKFVAMTGEDYPARQSAARGRHQGKDPPRRSGPHQGDHPQRGQPQDIGTSMRATPRACFTYVTEMIENGTRCSRRRWSTPCGWRRICSVSAIVSRCSRHRRKMSTLTMLMMMPAIANPRPFCPRCAGPGRWMEKMMPRIGMKRRE